MASYAPLRANSSQPSSSSSSKSFWPPAALANLNLNSPSRLPRPVQIIAGTAGFLLLTSLLGLWSPTYYYTAGPICDPYSNPGQVVFPENLNPIWLPFDRTCTAAPDWLELLKSTVRIAREAEQAGEVPQARERVRARRGLSAESLPGAENLGAGDFDPLEHMRGKYILVLGDSVDRNGLEQIAWLTGADWHSSSYERQRAGEVVQMEGWDIRGTPHVVEFPGTGGFKIVNGFYYGLDDTDEFRVQGDWHPPGRFEERVDELFKPMTDGLGKPAMISLHSGLWDLARFGRIDKSVDGNSSAPLTVERTEWWIERMRSVIAKTRRTWPGVPIWVRASHRIGDGAWASRDWSPGLEAHMEGDVKFHNFFEDKRCHQIIEMQRYVAETEGVAFFPFNNLWEGYQQYQDKVHPLVFPGGALYGQPLLHHFWMEMQPRGRSSWRQRILRGLRLQ